MNKNFDYLGNTFQIQLLNQVIVDKDFAQSIMGVIESSYFDNKYFKIIIQMIKEYYKKYQSTPNFETLDQIIKSEISQELISKIVIDTLGQIKNAPDEGSMFVQEKALKFCKQQELQKAMDKANKIISEGDFESYDKVEGLVRTALQVGEVDKGTTDIFAGLDDTHRTLHSLSPRYTTRWICTRNMVFSAKSWFFASFPHCRGWLDCRHCHQ